MWAERPANRELWPDVSLMLDHRLWRWPNIKSTRMVVLCLPGWVIRTHWCDRIRSRGKGGSSRAGSHTREWPVCLPWQPRHCWKTTHYRKTRRLTDVDLMSVQRRRRWPNIKSTLNRHPPIFWSGSGSLLSSTTLPVPDVVSMLDQRRRSRPNIVLTYCVCWTDMMCEPHLSQLFQSEILVTPLSYRTLIRIFHSCECK